MAELEKDGWADCLPHLEPGGQAEHALPEDWLAHGPLFVVRHIGRSRPRLLVGDEREYIGMARSMPRPSGKLPGARLSSPYAMMGSIAILIMFCIAMPASSEEDEAERSKSKRGISRDKRR